MGPVAWASNSPSVCWYHFENQWPVRWQKHLNPRTVHAARPGWSGTVSLMPLRIACPSLYLPGRRWSRSEPSCADRHRAGRRNSFDCIGAGCSCPFRTRAPGACVHVPWEAGPRARDRVMLAEHLVHPAEAGCFLDLRGSMEQPTSMGVVSTGWRQPDVPQPLRTRAWRPGQVTVSLPRRSLAAQTPCRWPACTD
jgi:hypothetical protein